MKRMLRNGFFFDKNYRQLVIIKFCIYLFAVEWDWFTCCSVLRKVKEFCEIVMKDKDREKEKEKEKRQVFSWTTIGGGLRVLQIVTWPKITVV